MYIADHFGIYLTDSQTVLLLKTIGCARYVYNLYLDVFNTVYKFTGRSMNYSSCCKSLTDLKKAVSWLKEADSTALQASLGFLCDGFSSFFKGQNNHPQFHKKQVYMRVIFEVYSCELRYKNELQVIDRIISIIKNPAYKR